MYLTELFPLLAVRHLTFFDYLLLLILVVISHVLVDRVRAVLPLHRVAVPVPGGEAVVDGLVQPVPFLWVLVLSYLCHCPDKSYLKIRVQRACKEDLRQSACIARSRPSVLLEDLLLFGLCQKRIRKH